MNKRQYPSINIINLQDFVLNKRNIENILQTVKVEQVITKKNTNQHSKDLISTLDQSFFIPRFYDKLFWCYFIINYGISNYEIIHGDGFQDIMQHKIVLIEQIRNNKDLLKKNKWKRRCLEDELVNQKKISLTAFICICAIKKHNIIYVDGRKFFTFIENNETSKVNIVEKTAKGYCLFIGTEEEKQKKYNFYRENYWQITNIDKPLAGISSYKLNDLKKICNKLKINTKDGEKYKKKKTLYANIQEYL